MTTYYAPEMNETRPTEPVADAEYFYGYYYVNTSLDLSGRGIELCDHLDGFGTKQTNERTYKMTRKAFEKFSETHTIAQKTLLD